MRRAVLLPILALLLLLLPLLIKNDFYVHLAIISSIYSIIVMGIILQLRVGLISIGAAAFWGIGAYSSALLTQYLALSFWLCLPLSGVIAAIIAFCLGFVLVKSRSIIGFLVLSLVVNAIFVEAVGHTGVLGGWAGITGIPRPTIYIPFHGQVEFISKITYYYLILFLIVVVALSLYSLYKSRIGRAWEAIGLSRPLAAQIGINIFRYRLLAYVIAALTAGLAGSFYAHYQCSLVPRMFDFFISFDFVLYGILGGLNYFLAGPIVGSLIGVVLPELLRIGVMFEPIFFGVVLILIILYWPEGVMSFLSKISASVAKYIRKAYVSS